MKPKYNFFANWGYALAGIGAMMKNEASFRAELAVVLPALVVDFYLPLTLLEHLFLGAVLVMILVVECLNSAVEACVDLVTKEFHPLAKLAKDCGSVAVFLTISFAVVSWGVVLLRLL